jgi:hypothetical protein
MKIFKIAVGVLLLSVILSKQSYAQTITLGASESAAPATQPATIQYDFPYPGILPDHPLYIVKVARDHFVGFLINDSLKKAEFNLLQSDKKIFAAQLLFEKEADALGVETLSKSNNYMHHAISDAKKAEGSKKPVENVVGKIEMSIDKHEEAIEILMNEDTDEQKSLQGELNRLRTIEKYFNELFPKK